MIDNLAAFKAARTKKAGAKPWGQRRFAVYDPSGTWVDVIEQIDPEPGFWEKY